MMHDIFFTILPSTLTLGYILLIVITIIGLFRLKKPGSTVKPFVSVVVAARNEEQNIQSLLSSLLCQDYPSTQYEIIIVDDDSGDQTFQSVRRTAQKQSHPPIHLIRSENREGVTSPKKHALSQGIQHSGGEWILLTDADCEPPRSWISGICQYATPETGMIVGYSPPDLFENRTFWQSFFQLDALSLAAMSAGTTGWGSPITCNGRNLAYRRSVFDQVGGFSQIEQYVSGDDDLFLQLVRHQTSWNIAYAYTADTVVPTHPPNSLKTFFHQRIRHASKGFHYHTRKTIVLSLVYLYNLLLLITLPISVFAPHTHPGPLMCWVGKTFFEWILLAAFANRMKRLPLLRGVLLSAPLHLVYVVVFGALGQWKSFQWKEGNYQTTQRKPS
jgi:cellulose synthase/poly-beta-1,6-N-acetylglucosamine synthase-like glycosyltransferase